MDSANDERECENEDEHEDENERGNLNMNLKHDVRAVARQFQIPGDFLDAAPYGSGHINDTYCVHFDQGGQRVRYIFQRINHNIFKTPVALMENVQRVTTHLAAKLAGQPEASRRVIYGVVIISMLLVNGRGASAQ